MASAGLFKVLLLSVSIPIDALGLHTVTNGSPGICLHLAKAAEKLIAPSCRDQKLFARNP